MEKPFLFQCAQDLGREKRIAIRVLGQIRDEVRFVLGRETVARCDQGAQGIGVEASQVDAQSFRFAYEDWQLLGEGTAPRQFVCAIRSEEKD